MVPPRDALHLSVRFCKTATAEALEARLMQLSDSRIRMACINYLEAVLDRVPNALHYLSQAAGPEAPFELPYPRPDALRSAPAPRSLQSS